MIFIIIIFFCFFIVVFLGSEDGGMAKHCIDIIKQI